MARHISHHTCTVIECLDVVVTQGVTYLFSFLHSHCCGIKENVLINIAELFEQWTIMDPIYLLGYEFYVKWRGTANEWINDLFTADNMESSYSFSMQGLMYEMFDLNLAVAFFKKLGILLECFGQFPT